MIVPVEDKPENQPDRPEGIQLQISRLSATNTRVEQGFSTENLTQLLDKYSCADLFSSSEFPNDKNKITVIPNNFSAHAGGIENPFIEKLAKLLIEGKVKEEMVDKILKIWKTNTLKHDAGHDIWCIKAEQAWLEFIWSPTSKSRPQPFVDSIPLTVWICKPWETQNGNNGKSKIVGKISDSEQNEENTRGGMVKKPLRRLYNGQDSESENSSNMESLMDANSDGREKRRTRQLLKNFYSEDSEKEDTKEATESSQRSHQVCDNHQPSANNPGAKNSSVDHNRAEGNNVQYATSSVAHFNGLAQIGPGIVKAQLTHFQYLFLMRLLDSFTKFQSQMNADVESFIGDGSPAFTFSFPLLVPDFEISLVCPELMPFEDLGSPSVTSTKEDSIPEPENQLFPFDGKGGESSQTLEVHSQGSG